MSLRVENGIIYKEVEVGNIPKKKLKSCRSCHFLQYHTEDVHIGYSCYDKHTIATCEAQEYSYEDTDSSGSLKALFEDCPVNTLLANGALNISNEKEEE